MKETPQEEIDLFSLVARFVQALKKNALLIIICVVLTTAVGVGLFLSAKKVYESKMMIFSDILTESYAEKLAATIQSLVWDGNYRAVADRLALTEEQARMIRRIDVASALDEAASTVEEADKLFLVVSVSVLDNEVLPDLQSGILRYIRENEFAKLREGQKRIFLTDLIKKVDQEIAKIESLKQRLSEGNYRGSDGMVIMDPSNPYAKTVELYREKLTYESELALLNSVQLVEGFAPLSRPVKPKITVFVPVGFFVGLILAFGIIGLNYISKISAE